MAAQHNDDDLNLSPPFGQFFGKRSGDFDTALQRFQTVKNRSKRLSERRARPSLLARGSRGAGRRARSHRCFVLPRIQFIPDSLTHSVPLSSERQCGRTLPGRRRPAARLRAEGRGGGAGGTHLVGEDVTVYPLSVTVYLVGEDVPQQRRLALATVQRLVP